MKNISLKGVAIVLVLALLFSGVIAWNVGIWNECRENNSWGYCMRVLSK